jgi:hypothetical protein
MKDKNVSAASSEIEEILTPKGESEQKPYLRYMNFDKYRIGLIENQNHEVIGIKSVEIIKKLYTDEQLSKRFDVWDVEEYFEED